MYFFIKQLEFALNLNIIAEEEMHGSFVTSLLPPCMGLLKIKEGCVSACLCVVTKCMS